MQVGLSVTTTDRVALFQSMLLQLIVQLKIRVRFAEVVRDLGLGATSSARGPCFSVVPSSEKVVVVIVAEHARLTQTHSLN